MSKTSVIRVWFGESYKAFAVKQKTTTEELMKMVAEKLEIKDEDLSKYSVFEKKPDIDLKERPLDVLERWKRDKKKEGAPENKFVWKKADGTEDFDLLQSQKAKEAPPTKPIKAATKPEQPPQWVNRTKKSNEETEGEKKNWERIQTKAFTGWINNYLKKRQLEVNDVTKDLDDGLMLINLLEIICGTTLSGYDKKPKVRLQKVQNLGIALGFVAQKGIKTVGIHPEAFIDGNLKLILGCIWLLIHKFEIADISEAALSAKDGLMLWCINRTAGYKDVKIENFHKSWQDGLAFAALIHKHRPDLIQYAHMSKDTPEQNLRTVFEVAYKSLEIPKLLDPADIIRQLQSYHKKLLVLAKLHPNSIPKPDERSIMTYLAQLFQKFSSTHKSELSRKRIERVVALTRLNDGMKDDYTNKAKQLNAWISDTISELGNREFLNTSIEAVEENLSAFLRYKNKEKTAKTITKLDVEGLLNNIQTKLWADARPAYSPAPGVCTEDINRNWEKLAVAEKEREDALRKELERLNKLDYLHKKLQSKSVLLKTWIAEKKEYLTKTDYGDTLSAVQAKIRRHDAFEQQYSTHQTRLKELHQIIAQIEALGAQNEDVNSTLAIQQDWAELKKLSEQRRAVLTEKLAFQQQLDAWCTQFAKRAEELYLWLDKVTEYLTEPIICNSISGVQALQNSLSETAKQCKDKQPLYDECVELASKLKANGMADLRNVSEYSMEQVVSKWKTVDGIVASRGRELNMEMIKQNHHERLRVDFAKKAKEFVEWIDQQKADLEVDGELEEKLAAAQKKIGEKDVAQSKLNFLQDLNQLLVDAHITDLSTYTELTMQALVVQFDQYVTLIKNKTELIESQIAAKKMGELTPEQLHEFKVCFGHFDCDGDNKLSPHEFRAGCAGLGIDLKDEEMEDVLNELDPEAKGYIGFEEFTKFMVSRTQIRDTFDEVLASFTALADSKDVITEDQLKNHFSGQTLQYLLKTMPAAGNARDYSSYAGSLFER